MMPKLKHFDVPEHVAFICDAVREDLQFQSPRNSRTATLLRGLASLRKYNPSIDAVATIAEASGATESELRVLDEMIRRPSSRDRATNGYWLWVRRARDRRTPRVYFLASGDLLKTGCSRFVDERVRYLQTHATTEHRLIGSIPGGFKTEREWHARFAHLRSHREWFHATPEIMAAIDEALSTIEGAERSDYEWSPPALASA